MLAARIFTGVVFGAAVTAAILFAPSPVTAGVLALLWLLYRHHDGARAA